MPRQRTAFGTRASIESAGPAAGNNKWVIVVCVEQADSMTSAKYDIKSSRRRLQRGHAAAGSLEPGAAGTRSHDAGMGFGCDTGNDISDAV